ncbi:hypothetical protein BDY24DRAFT_401974 [Mrakia frigida]|uniref:uncharacterized protein n=1 Tax=Mrakia frigida TaxID=29902 RepID=UPI003FCC066F
MDPTASAASTADSSFPLSSSSTSTTKPRQGKERSGSLLGGASRGKPKAVAGTGPTRAAKKKKNGDEGGGGAAKVLQRKDGTLRTQYSSCGACRLRRVRCSLTDVKSNYLASPDATALSLIDGELVSASGTVLKCLNCLERGLRCVDSYNPNLPAPPPINRSGPSYTSSTSSNSATSFTGPSTSKSLPASLPDPPKPAKTKALRKGKRVLQVEDEFGGANFARGTQGLTGSGRKIPELKKAFLSSEFYSAFHTQRPMLDPEDFARRFLVTDPPKAESLGPVGSIIPHVLYAWALSYGVDESGKEAPPPTTNEDRIRRRQKCNEIVTECLGEIDRYAVMRRPTWDGVRVLLMILPLTEDTSPPIERLAMYECAVAQVYSLCSMDSLTYDLGVDNGADSTRWGNATGDQQRPEFLVRARVYWYCFVHEAIKTGLKGGRLVMDEDDLEEFQASGPASHKTLTPSPNGYHLAARYATAPIRLAQACRLIHQALTGPKARRKDRVDSGLLKQAWESLESCWEEFHHFRSEGGEGDELGSLKTRDMVRFCDGWQIFMYECHSVIREALADRVTNLLETVNAPRLQSMDSDTSSISAANLLEAQRLHAIAESKCYNLARLVVIIVKRNLGTRFFGYDASLVRDGVYYAASILAVDGGSSSDINACLAAFDEMRWAFSKTYERTEKIKALWASSLDADGQPRDANGPLPSVSAYLPYPLRPTGVRTRSRDPPPPPLQRMPSYASETYTEDSNGQGSSSSNDHLGEAPSQTVYASGLVADGPSSGSSYRNRGSLARSLDVTLKLEDDSPEGGVWALPPSSQRGGSRSRHPSRGGSGSLGSSPGELRVWREEGQLEVNLADTRYDGGVEEEPDAGLGPGPSTFVSEVQGYYPPEESRHQPSVTLAPLQHQDIYISEPMDARSSYDSYLPPPQPHSYENSSQLFEPARYEAPRHNSYTYEQNTSYPSYPSHSPPQPPPLSQVEHSSAPYLQHFDLRNPPAPVDSPLHPQQSYPYAEPSPYHHSPNSLPPIQHSSYQHPFERHDSPSNSSFPPPPPLHHSHPTPPPPNQYQYTNQQQHPQTHSYQYSSAMDTLAPAPSPRDLYRGENEGEGMEQDGGGGYFSQADMAMRMAHERERNGGGGPVGGPPSGYTSNFPRHG